MAHHHSDDRRYSGQAERLRSEERVTLLEVNRVISISVEGLSIHSVLDIGTGTGLFAEAFLSSGMSVTGIDVNGELLRVARLTVPDAEFREAPAEHLPFEDKTFDLVFLGLVLHELDDIPQALAEMRRVTRLRVAILEWPYRSEEHGPPIEHRLPEKTILEYNEKAGFQNTRKYELSNVDLYLLDL